jgi:hypothetical protein
MLGEEPQDLPTWAASFRALTAARRWHPSTRIQTSPSTCHRLADGHRLDFGVLAFRLGEPSLPIRTYGAAPSDISFDVLRPLWVMAHCPPRRIGPPKHQRAHHMLDEIRGYLRDEQGAEIIDWVIVWPDAAP